METTFTAHLTRTAAANWSWKPYDQYLGECRISALRAIELAALGYEVLIVA